MLLTVFTPTYNRGYILNRLYQSLSEMKGSSRDDFEWLIVDDGSSDDTEVVVKRFIQENKLSVRYIRKNHEGKHAAYNLAVGEAEGEFFFNVDSDDCIASDCLTHLKTIAQSIRNNNRLAGYISMKSDRNGILLGSPFARNLHVASFAELREAGYNGEYSIIFQTEIARRYPFPIIEGETFMPESVVYDRMGKFQFFLDNTVSTVCEYLPDGLSLSWNRLRIENPRGFMLYHMEQADRSTDIKSIIRNLIDFNIYRTLAGRQGHKCEYAGRYPMAAAMLFPIARIVGLREIHKISSAHEV